jgi:hypothetical protein
MCSALKFLKDKEVKVNSLSIMKTMDMVKECNILLHTQMVEVPLLIRNLLQRRKKKRRLKPNDHDI